MHHQNQQPRDTRYHTKTNANEVQADTNTIDGDKIHNLTKGKSQTQTKPKSVISIDDNKAQTKIYTPDEDNFCFLLRSQIPQLQRVFCFHDILVMLIHIRLEP